MTSPRQPLPTANGHRRLVRRAGLLAGAVLAVMLAPFVAVVGFGLIAPYASAPIPSHCTASAPNLPTTRSFDVPGVGTGTLLAREGDRAVVAVADGSKATAAIVDTRDGTVVTGVHMQSDVVAAAIVGGVVYLFDDKIGYLLRPSDGQPLPRIIESDNYRGLFVAGGTRYVQTDGQFWVLGLDSVPFTAQHVDFATVADGCFIAPPGG